MIPSMNMTSGPQQHKFLDLNVHDDDTTEPSGSVTIVLLEDPSYCIEDRMAWARVRIYDDDQPAGATLPDTAWRTGPGGAAQAGKVQHMEAIFSDLMMFILATFIKEAGNPSQAPVCAGDRRARLG